MILWVDNLGWSLLGLLACIQLIAAMATGSKTNLAHIWWLTLAVGWMI